MMKQENLPVQDKHNERNFMTNSKTEIQELENLLISEDLEELNNLTGNFNIFNTLKLQNNEICHSNFLAWIMSPFETHGLGDYFLKEFLKSAIKDYSLDENIEISLKDIVFLDLDDTEIKREYKNIDLLLISLQNKFVCIIENKIWTGEHDCQLERYAEIVNSEFKDFKKLYIYLSPTNECNSELLNRCYQSSNNTVYYIPMNYLQVHDVINKTLKFKAKSMNEDVKIFIEHYNSMLERNIMGQISEDVIALCRKIYRENKSAIDLIVENNDFKAELYEVLLDVLRSQKDIKITSAEDYYVQCLPSQINNEEKLKFADWTPDGIIVHIHFVCNFKWKKCLYVEIAVGKTKDNDNISSSKRAKLIELLQEKLGFKKFNGNNNWAYTPYRKILGVDEFYKCNDSEELKFCLEEKIKEIKDLYVVKLQEALNEYNPEF